MQLTLSAGWLIGALSVGFYAQHAPVPVSRLPIVSQLNVATAFPTESSQSIHVPLQLFNETAEKCIIRCKS